MKERIKQKIKQTKFYNLYINYKKFYSNILLKTLFPKAYVKKLYRLRTCGKEVNLENPRTFDDKINWIKLNIKDPNMSICADKYAVRNYITEHGYGEYLNELYGVYDNAKEIDFDKLPEQFILKCNHGNNYNIICKDKTKLDRDATVKQLNQWLKEKFYLINLERHYKTIRPRIICERYIEPVPEGSGALTDYKFYCFNGNVRYCRVDMKPVDRFYFKYFDMNWTEQDFIREAYYTDLIIEKPKCFDLMVEIAQELSQPFIFVRMDFFIENDRPVIGEITLTPYGGHLIQAVTESALLTLGDQFQLPL